MGTKYKAMHEINRESPDETPPPPEPRGDYWGLHWWELAIILIITIILGLMGRR